MAAVKLTPSKDSRFNRMQDAVSDADCRLNAIENLLAYHPELEAVNLIGLAGLIELVRKDLMKALN